jgi:Rod binding domain-containing protein
MRIESPAPAAAPAPKDDPSKIAGAAKQFEALLIGQMLKSVAESSSGGWMGSGSESGSSAMEMAQEHFASALSAQGGLGLSKMIVKGLTKTAVAPHPKAQNTLP